MNYPLDLDTLLGASRTLSRALEQQQLPTMSGSRRDKGPARVLPMIRTSLADFLSSRISEKEIDDITQGLEKLQILQLITKRASRKSRTANVNSIDSYASPEKEEFEVNCSGFQGRSQRNYHDDNTYKWCKNIRSGDIRPQAPHKYMSQCHDYKKFIGMGVIHESDDNNYICLGPWSLNRSSMPVQFSSSSDTPRRDQVIARTIKTKFSHIPERREKALQEEEESRKIAQQSTGVPNESTIGNIGSGAILCP